MTKKLYVFDFDGTLVDTSRDILNSVNHVRQTFKKEILAFSEAKIHIGAGQDALIEGAIREGNTAIDFARAKELYQEHHRTHMLETVHFYPGITDLLTQLTHNGAVLGIVSNKYSYYIKDILHHLHNSFDFKIIYGSESLAEKKPHPMPVIEASKQTGIPLTDTIMIGDTQYDIQAGRSAGAFTIACAWGFNSREALASFSPDYIVDHPLEILKIQ